MSRNFTGDDLKNEVRARSDLVSVVSQFVNLKNTGRSFVGLCPFHQEKTPSFHVDPDKQLFHCFGCGAGGDVFSFIMKIKGLTFFEALEDLARQAGIAVTKRQGPRRGRREAGAALEAVKNAYVDMLGENEGAKALSYLKTRGVSGESIKRFELGYAPSRWEFAVSLATRSGISLETMLKAGIVTKRRSGGYYDRFRDRLMFPIKDSSGDIVGFGGRSFGDDHPKYLNSPDSDVFHKGRELYGLNLAKPAIRGKGTVLVVEGYMDVIALWQNGIDYAVAPMGTALTLEQARVLLLIAKKIVLAYDSDEAGKKATARSCQVIREVAGRSYIAIYEGAKDPDEFLKKEGASSFQSLVDSAVPDIEYLCGDALRGLNTATVDGKLRAKDSLLPVLGLVEDGFERQAYVEEFSRIIGLEKDFLAKEVELSIRERRRREKYKKVQDRDTNSYGNRNVVDDSPSNKGSGRKGSKINLARQKAEEGVIRCLVENTELLRKVTEVLTEEDFQDPDAKAAFGEMAQKPYGRIEDEEILSYIAGLCAKSAPVDETERILDDCLTKLRSYKLEELENRMMKAQRENDDNALRTIRVDYMNLLREIKSRR